LRGEEIVTSDNEEEENCTSLLNLTFTISSPLNLPHHHVLRGWPLAPGSIRIVYYHSPSRENDHA